MNVNNKCRLDGKCSMKRNKNVLFSRQGIQYLCIYEIITALNGAFKAIDHDRCLTTSLVVSTQLNCLQRVRTNRPVST